MDGEMEVLPAVIEREESLELTPVMNLERAKAKLAEFQKFVGSYLIEGEDFGTIEGTVKPTLYKPGADKLCELYGLADTYEILNRVEDWDRFPPLFDYDIRCTLTRKRDSLLWASGLGSCNSYEGRYYWRNKSRVCPECKKETIIKGKEEFGGGWLCFKKKGGCGAKFLDGDETIEKQEVGKVENDDMATLKNTILKMAKKRAKVDATLAATRSSGIFTQDMEDITPKKATEGKPAPQEGSAKPTAAMPQRKSETSGATNGNTISDKQVTRLWALGYAATPPKSRLEIIEIVKRHGFDSVLKITRGKYDAICSEVEAKDEVA